jgi:hypothetical protein
MSLQHATLPDILITELYKNIFIINSETDQKNQLEVISHTESEVIKYLGNNSKRIVILVKQPSDVFLPETHLEFLSKILAACKLNIGDVAIVNAGFRFVDIHAIKQQLQPNHIILFGIEPTELKLPLSFPHFKVQGYANSTYLSVPSLDILNNDTEEGKLLKTKLWVCLKTMFEVSGEK